MPAPIPRAVANTSGLGGTNKAESLRPKNFMSGCINIPTDAKAPPLNGWPATIVG